MRPYLVLLGVRALLDAWRGGGPRAPEHRFTRARSPFRQGLLSNVLNPKIALVFTTLIPQFVEPGDPAAARTFLLAGIFIAMGLAWLTSYALLVARVGDVLRRPAVRRAANAFVGTMLTVFGLRLAFERR